MITTLNDGSRNETNLSRFISKSNDRGNEYAIHQTQDYFDHMAGIYYDLWGSSSSWGIFSNPNVDIKEAALQSTRYLFDKISIQPNTLVLDLACGSGGSISVLLRERQCRAIGVDISSTQLSLASKTLSACEKADYLLVKGDAHNIPLLSNTFPVVSCLGAFFYFQNSSLVVSEIKRVLQPGGYFLLDDMVEIGPLTDEERSAIYFRHHIEKLGSVSNYRKMLAAYGLEIVAHENVTEHFSLAYAAVLRGLPSFRDRLHHECGIGAYEQMWEWFQLAERLGNEGRLGRWLCVTRKSVDTVR